MSDNRDEFTQWWDKAHGNFRGSAVYKSVARSAWEARDEKLGRLERDRARLLEYVKGHAEAFGPEALSHQILASLEIKDTP